MKFILHLHPPQLPVEACHFRRTFGLGGSALVLFVLLLMTGMLELFVYDPTVAEAYPSVQQLQQMSLGRWVRNIHYLSAQLIVVVSFLHLLRVFLTGGYSGVRRGNWWIGLVVLFVLLCSAFTGYLLPWDQLSFWAVTICSKMFEYVPLIGAGLQQLLFSGSEVGPATLHNFYILHTIFLPGTITVLLVFHFWFVRKARGVILPQSHAGQPEVRSKVPSYPDLVFREAAVALNLCALVLILAVFIDAPLGLPANPGMSPNPVKAPWYYLGVQELLIHFQPLVAIVIAPCCAALFLFLLPMTRLKDHEAGRWFVSRRGLSGAVIAFAIALLSVPALIILNSVVPFPFFPAWIGHYLLPLGGTAILIGGAVLFMRRMAKMTQAEIVLVLFVFFATTVVILTITGIFFRGAEMALVLPSWMAL